MKAIHNELVGISDKLPTVSDMSKKVQAESRSNLISTIFELLQKLQQLNQLLIRRLLTATLPL